MNTVTLSEDNFKGLELLAVMQKGTVQDVANELIARGLVSKARPTAIWPPKAELRLKGER